MTEIEVALGLVEKGCVLHPSGLILISLSLCEVLLGHKQQIKPGQEVLNANHTQSSNPKLIRVKFALESVQLRKVYIAFINGNH